MLTYEWADLSRQIESPITLSYRRSKRTQLLLAREKVSKQGRPQFPLPRPHKRWPISEQTQAERRKFCPSNARLPLTQTKSPITLSYRRSKHTQLLLAREKTSKAVSANKKPFPIVEISRRSFDSARCEFWSCNMHVRKPDMSPRTTR